MIKKKKHIKILIHCQLKFGLSNWELNIPQSIAGKSCDSGTSWSKGLTAYGVYLLDGIKLFWAGDDEGYPSSLNLVSSYTFTKQ